MGGGLSAGDSIQASVGENLPFFILPRIATADSIVADDNCSRRLGEVDFLSTLISKIPVESLNVIESSSLSTLFL